ncbi:Crp/Fnr family transcriptional regulator [Fulvivirga maritima]|uniref:Crp/Fnr family transcriptional regulator n=1 Tax=Fulvivirga maritima TaxID=2904247 RepID=UPI001F3839DB|nr:Crp/Fnr family transcriptional regulator [Fulvivirga maritima]UII27033.1 Crp/Fnr family transcriptional regulator [Fulvivirga maritima]
MQIVDVLTEYFPELYEEELVKEIKEKGSIVQVEAENKIMDFGQFIKNMPLLYEGAIKVLRQDEEGHELFLYYLQPGQTCAISLTCCLAQERSQIRAIAEEDSYMIQLPVHLMDEWMTKYKSWKNFVMNTYRERFEELLSTIDSVAFHKMDERLWTYLIDKSSARNTHKLEVTHQQIAHELNSTREVISRLLKQLERQGKVKLGRNEVKLIL